MSCPKCNECPMPVKYGTPQFDPRKAIEGDPASPIWVVSLNPKTKGENHKSGQPNPFDWSKSDRSAPHFLRLKVVLGDHWYAHLLEPGGIAHTDLVKCGSPAFADVEEEAVLHCRDFLVNQISEHRPKLLLVLSSDACRFISAEAKLAENRTEGKWQFGSAIGENCYVVLSGYTSPQQERYAKIRLGRDFLAACKRLELNPPKELNEPCLI